MSTKSSSTNETAASLGNDSHFDMGNARAAVINRTHRIVRQRATSLQAKRSWLKGVLLPLMLCSIVLVTACYAVWDVFGQSELSSLETPEASSQIFVLLLWFLPISLVALGFVWLRRGGDGIDDEATR